MEAPHDQRYDWAYLFGAACPQRRVAAGLVMPAAKAEAMSLHLTAMGRKVAAGSHAALILDGAGYHLAAALTIPEGRRLLSATMLPNSGCKSWSNFASPTAGTEFLDAETGRQKPPLNARTSAETKIRELSGRKSPQKRPIWRRIGNVWFARAGWWCAQSVRTGLDNQLPVIPCYFDFFQG